jgi:hypothetical protein
MVLLLHKAKDAYGHRQRNEYVIKKTEDCAGYISELEQQSGEEVW